MSRYYQVAVNLTLEVKVPDTGDDFRDAEAAGHIAETLVRKRINECTWGEGNPWTATVMGDQSEVTDVEESPDPDDEFEEDDEEDGVPWPHENGGALNDEQRGK